MLRNEIYISEKIQMKKKNRKSHCTGWISLENNYIVLSDHFKVNISSTRTVYICITDVAWVRYYKSPTSWKNRLKKKNKLETSIEKLLLETDKSFSFKMPKATSKSVLVSHTYANEGIEEPQSENEFQEAFNTLHESSSDEEIVLKRSQPKPSTSQIQVIQ